MHSGGSYLVTRDVFEAKCVFYNCIRQGVSGDKRVIHNTMTALHRGYEVDKDQYGRGRDRKGNVECELGICVAETRQDTETDITIVDCSQVQM